MAFGCTTSLGTPTSWGEDGLDVHPGSFRQRMALRSSFHRLLEVAQEPRCGSCISSGRKEVVHADEDEDASVLCLGL